MERLKLSCYALNVCAAVILLEGCSGSPIVARLSGAPVLPSSNRDAVAGSSQSYIEAIGGGKNRAHYAQIYAFRKAPDGSTPLASLIDRSGTLYGTTERGGASGGGTVFSVTTTGEEKVLHSFDAGGDGFYPSSNLIDVGGLLYGTTSGGGAHGCPASVGQECGTVFSIRTTTSGTEKVLYSFNFKDGAKPLAGLINVKGTLYGTTSAGGEYDCYPFTCGVVFSITTAGVEKVLHDFGKGTDGVEPAAGLINVGGTLYGTTERGGAFGYGTVFSITMAGHEKVLHSFDFTDGAFPSAGLVEVGGLLYGTTGAGGEYSYCQGTQFPTPCGSVFSITKAGQEKILLSFKKTDGAFPSAGLLNVKGTLYGTTSAGGLSCYEPGCGTVFSITTAGQEKVLHYFSMKGGWAPVASLIYKGGRLIGTTSTSNRYTRNHGTVFSLAP